GAAAAPGLGRAETGSGEVGRGLGRGRDLSGTRSEGSGPARTGLGGARPANIQVRTSPVRRIGATKRPSPTGSLSATSMTDPATSRTTSKDDRAKPTTPAVLSPAPTTDASAVVLAAIKPMELASAVSPRPMVNRGLPDSPPDLSGLDCEDLKASMTCRRCSSMEPSNFPAVPG